MTDCETCMQTRDQQTRQLLGCGYTPPVAAKFLPMVSPWHGLGYKGDKPTTCPGYTCNLPETIEIARARLHWSKNAHALESFCGGPVSAGMLLGMEILEGASNELSNWQMTPSSKGGGAE